jgi:predicted nucleic acid-binding protein
MTAKCFVDTKQLSCHTVFSEDLNHGQVYDGVTVVNPFAAAAAP